MIKTVVLIPERDNAGRAFPRSAWTEFEMRLFAFGGWSRTRGVAGAWQDQGRISRDVSRRYEVALGSWGQLPAWLGLVRWARTRFDQEALYIEVVGLPEVWTGKEP